MSSRKEYERLFEIKGRLDSSLGKSFTNTKNVIEKLQKQIKSVNDVMKKTSSYEKTKKSLEQNKQSLKELKETYENLKKELNNTNSSDKNFEKLNKNFEKTEKKIKKTNEQIENQRKRLQELQGELTDTGIDTNNLASENERLQRSFDELAETSNRMQEWNNAFISTKDKAKAANMSLLRTVGGYTAAGIGLYKAFAEPTAEFQEQMAAVKALSNVTDSEYEKLSKKAKQTASESKFTSKEVGQAYEYMAMAGWKAEQMLYGLPGVINAAAASNEDLGLVADIITDGLSAMKMKAEDAEHFADVLAATAANSNTNIAMLGESFTYCAPLAGSLGFSIEDLSLALGLMANSGIKASQGGTTLRRIFSNISSDFDIVLGRNEKGEPTNSFHVSVEEDGKMRPLRDIIIDIREAFNGMSEEQKKAMENDLAKVAEENGIALSHENGQLKTQAELYAEVSEVMSEMTETGRIQEAEAIAQKTAMSGFLSLVNVSDDEFNKLAYSIDNCKGSAERMAKTRLDSLNGQITLLKSAWEGFTITLGENLTPALTENVKELIEMVNAANEWAKKNPEIVKQIAKLIVQFAALHIGGKALKALFLDFKTLYLGVGKTIKTVTTSVKLAKGAFSALSSGNGIRGAVSAISSLSSGSAAAAGGISALGTSAAGIAATLAAPLAAVGVAVAGIGTAMYIYKRNFKKLKLEDMEKRFGNIVLSMEEMETLAKRMVSEDNFENIANAVQNFSKLDDAKTSLKEIKNEVDKFDWKMDIGLKLSNEEIEEFKKNSINYFEQIKNYFAEQSYTVKVGLSTIGLGDLKFVKSMETMTIELQNYMNELQEEYTNHLEKAFVDGAFNVDEYEAAQAVCKKIDKINQIIIDEQLNSDIEKIKLDFSLQGLDSYEDAKLMYEKTNEATEEYMNNYKKIAADTIAGADSTYKSLLEVNEQKYADKKISLEEYNKNKTIYDSDLKETKEETNLSVRKNEIKIKSDNIKLWQNTIMDIFADKKLGSMISEIEKAQGGLEKERKLNAISQTEYKEISEENMTDIILKYENLNAVERDNLKESLEGIAEEVEALEGKVELYKMMGDEVPEEIDKVIQRYYLLKAILDSVIISTEDFKKVSFEISSLDEYINYGEGNKINSPAKKAALAVIETKKVSQKGNKTNGIISLGKKFVSNIPGYAKGTNYTPDTFIAGENGAELITGSRNKKVYDALETKNIFDSINLLNLQKTEPERIENKDNINSNIVLNITNSPVIYADNTDDLDAKLKNNNERLIQTIYEQINEKALKERRMFYR